MGILDEAIREHLELKRQQGAADSELRKLEDDAFGPPARPGTEPDAAVAEAPTTVAPTEPAGEEAGVEDEFFSEQSLSDELDQALEGVETEGEAAPRAPEVEEPEPEPEPEPDTGAHEPAPEEPEGYDEDQQGEVEESEEEGEDVLEETPEFLQ